MTKELKPCPFCHSEKLDFSLKTATKQHNGKAMYHGTIYCKDCHAYGTRVLCYSDSMYRCSEEELTTFREQASIAWNGIR